MTKLGALVSPARQLLVADNHAEVTTLWVHTLRTHRTAHLLALVLLAFLEHVAGALAPKIVNLVHLILGHPLAAQVVWVLDFVAWELRLGLIANAGLVDELLTPHALPIVALLDALMGPTGQEFLAKGIADRDGLHTRFALPTQQALDRLVPTWAEDLS